MTGLQGDQIAISATTETLGGERVYLVWMLADGDDPAFQARLAAKTPGQAIDDFTELLSAYRLRKFSWPGPASAQAKRGKLQLVSAAADTEPPKDSPP